jgi:hypothetical protein
VGLALSAQANMDGKGKYLENNLQKGVVSPHFVYATITPPTAITQLGNQTKANYELLQNTTTP